MFAAGLSDVDQTIAAIASAPGGGARGIVRLSGPDTVDIVRQLICDRGGEEPDFHPRVARRYEFQLQLGERPVRFPVAVLLWPTARSYTGQPSAELHTLGAPAVLERILEILFQLGARPARAGEFTLRSFLAGRMSLVEAEAVLGVIDARSERQLDTALQQLAGGISLRMRRMRDRLLDDLADLEAGLDFVEEDIDFLEREEFGRRLQAAVETVQEMQSAARTRMDSQTRPRIVLAGLPNAGKSTLFNRLTGRRALISPVAGTTTDYLLGEFTVEGQELTLLDTAGWETGSNETVGTGIGQLAQQLRESESQRADLIVWCSSGDLLEADFQQDAAGFARVSEAAIPCARLWTKSDCQPEWDRSFPVSASSVVNPVFELSVSAATDEGIDLLRQMLAKYFQEQPRDAWEMLGSTAARCRDALAQTLLHLESARELVAAGEGDELLAEELRAAIRELGLILGHVYTDDLLDRVFSKFCIGK